MQSRRKRSLSALLALLVMAAALSSQVGSARRASAATGTIGQTTIGTLTSTAGDGYKFGTGFALTTPATAQSFSFYVRGGTASQRFTPLVYSATAGGDPSALVATGSEVTVAANQAAGWVTSTLPALNMAAGTYFLALLSGPTGDAATLYYNSVANAGVWNPNAYPTATNPWGTVNREGRSWSFYLTYATPDAPPMNTALPAITGTAQTGATLTASTGTWTNAPTTYAYQWQACNNTGASCTNIATATTSTLVVPSTSLGGTIRVIVTASNASGPGAPATSNATAIITAPAPPSNTALPTITGTAQQGAVLTATTGTWTNSPTSYAYLWQRCNTAGASCVAITTATSSTYGPTATDVGSTLRVGVTASNAAGPGTAAVSAATAIVTAQPTTATFGQTTIGASSTTLSGNTKYGSSFALSTSGTTQSFSFYTRGGTQTQSFVAAIYQQDTAGSPSTLVTSAPAFTVAANRAAGWVTVTLPAVNLSAGNYYLALLASSPGSRAFMYYDAITNAGVRNANTYPTPSATWGTVTREGRRWSFYVTYTPTVITSPPSNTVLPAITGSTQQGATLTSSTGTWTNTPASYAYQWQRCNTSGAACTNIGTATQSTYVLTATDVGSTLRSIVTASNSIGASQPATSNATAVVVAGPPQNTALPSITGAAQDTQVLTAATGTWTNSPTSYAYQWQRCNTSGAACTNISTATASTFTLTSTDVGATLRVVVTATNAAGAGTPATSNATAVVTAAPGFQSSIQVDGLTMPVAVTWTPDGRMFIPERLGTVKVVPAGGSVALATPLLTLPSVATDVEQGLNNILLDPNFATNGYFYLAYTHGTTLKNRVSRFTAVGNTASPASELVIWQDTVNAASAHQGGGMAVGPDGKFYFAVGDGEDQTAGTAHVSQRLDSYRGKILRYNFDGTIPADNPFNDGAGPNLDAIWARGLRNPWRMSFDSVTGRFYIADVGGNDPSTSQEEVNIGVAGANYGWPFCEGTCAVSGTTNPFYFYGHGGRDASITGGFVYRGTQFPVAYRGNYFFGDYTQNYLKRLNINADGSLGGLANFLPANGAIDTAIGDIVDIQMGPDGSLYYTDLATADISIGILGTGKIRKVSYVTGNQPPVISSATATPSNAPSAPATITFAASVSDPENDTLTYTWNFGDNTTGTAKDITHTYTALGSYTARLTVSDGTNQVTSNAVTVRVGNAPVPTIVTPAANSTFKANDVIAYSGSAIDPDETLPASAYSWTVIFHHDTHIHPFLGPVTGTSGTFTIPATGHDWDSGTNLEIILTVTDSTGLTGSTSITINPQLVNLTFTASTPGLTVSYDQETNVVTPFTRPSLIGFQHNITTASPQTLSTTTYTFASWSDAGAQTHTITSPATNATFMATFTASAPTTGRFGNQTIGTVIATPGANYKFGSIYSLTQTARLQSFSFYAAGGTAAQTFLPVIYSTSGGNPSALVAQGSPVTISVGQAAGWVTVALPTTVTLAPGTYLLGLLSSTTNAGARVYYSTQTNGAWYNPNTYPTPSATWGSIFQENRNWSYYVTYTV